jgi:hypothetical protein
MLITIGWYASRADKRVFVAFLANLLEGEGTRASFSGWSGPSNEVPNIHADVPGDGAKKRR